MARGKTVDVAAILGGQLAKVSDSNTPDPSCTRSIETITAEILTMKQTAGGRDPGDRPASDRGQGNAAPRRVAAMAQ